MDIDSSSGVESPPENRNSLFAIFPYKEGGMWVFDDERVGLIKEPFVAGADTLLDMVCKGKDKIGVIFSNVEFPDKQLTLTMIDEEGEGTNYYCTEMNHYLWLCPALNLYYKESPKKLFLKIKI